MPFYPSPFPFPGVSLCFVLKLMLIGRSKRSQNQPLNLSRASNSLQFSTHATRYYKAVGPPPEPIGKRGSSVTTVTISHEKRKATSSVSDTYALSKLIGRGSAPGYEYDISAVKKPHSRPPSVKSSRKSSVRSIPVRTAQKRQSIDTIRSRVSAASIMSGSRLSAKFDRLIIEEPASLMNIPVELVHAIIQYVSRLDLLNLNCTSKQMYAETIMLLYARPHFASTYRYAQFVSTISHNQRLASLVRELHLSPFTNMPKNGLAGWREWKYRTEALYTLYPNNDTPDNNNSDQIYVNHPLAHPLLLKYSPGVHDVPLGSLLHIVKSCPHLRYLTSQLGLIEESSI
jgi:hypothetical protein